MAAGVTSPERSGKGANSRGGRRARCPAARLPDVGSRRVRHLRRRGGLASLRVGLPVDLVLSDVAMPQLNRIQLLEALSVSHPDLPVLPDLTAITLVPSTPAQRSRPEPERLSSRRPRSERRLSGAPPNRARLR